MSELLVIENLTHRFSNVVLKNIRLKLPQGEMIGLVGPDGAGKTTLLRLIAALLIPTEGTIRVLGCDTVKEAETIHGFSAYMPQRFGLYEDLTVKQNLDLYARLYQNHDRAIYEKLLHFTGLAPFTSRLARDLSGGMKQKLGLACALIQNPKLLILDEPSVGVDPISRRELWKMVQSLLSKEVSVLWSTTYLDEAEKCDRIILLNQGELLYEGEARGLIERVEKRVFKVAGGDQKRELLSALEKREDVVDAMIQGSDIRVVAKGATFQGTPIEPRLEDAFIDLLGGQEKGESVIAQAAPVSLAGDGERVVAKGLVKKFGTFSAVSEISFAVKKGEIFGLLGPNGAGKSTTFKMLCGLLKPTEGEAYVNGVDIKRSTYAAHTHIGYMAQRFSLYDSLSVEQNLSFFAGIYPVQGTLEEKLTLFGLTEYREALAGSLPLGFKQRLGLAAAMLHWPEVLFLDEPTSGMDPVSRRKFWSEMNGLVRKGKTILVSTHFMDEAENCDRIALIYRGLIIHLGAPDELKKIVQSASCPNPTMEDAFIHLVEAFDAAHP